MECMRKILPKGMKDQLDYVVFGEKMVSEETFDWTTRDDEDCCFPY
jgi:hypothetical protein